MGRYMPQLVRDTRGDDWIQKALYITLIVLAAAGVMAGIGTQLTARFQRVLEYLSG